MEGRTKTLKAFADYLRKELKEPQDWDVKLFGEFPGTVSMLQKYFAYILEQGKSRRKIEAIEKHYNLHQYSSLKRKKEALNGRPRSIEKFFKENTVPYEKNLNFIALVFEAPVQTLEEYAEIPGGNEEVTASAKGDDAAIHALTGRNALAAIKNKSKQLNCFFSGQKVIYVAFIFAVIALALFWSVDFRGKAEKKNLSATGEAVERLQVNSFLPKYIGDSLFVRSNAGIGTPFSVDNDDSAGVFYHTVNIFNDKCLYKHGDWSFPVDDEGEDMNSQYGTPFYKNITTLYPVFKTRATIANKMMDIHFNLKNQLDEKLFFSSFKVEILETYNASAENAKYNLYNFRGQNNYFKVVFDKTKAYGFTTDKKPVDSGGSLFAKLRVKGNSKCAGLICRFRIICDLVDDNGNHFQIHSDKDYLIGFVKP